MKDHFIRVATDNDLRSIAKWLKQELENDVEGTFFNNIGMIENGAKSDRLVALIRAEDSMPVAFYLWNEHETNVDIFSVKGDCRRRGLGKRLASHFIDDAKRRDLIGLVGECAPVSSMPFWKSMGFNTIRSPHGSIHPNWVGLPLPRKHLFPNGRPCQVEISIAPEEGRVFQPTDSIRAVESDGRIHLRYDFVHYAPVGDPFIDVGIDGRSIWNRKLKYFSTAVEIDRPWYRVRCFRLDTVGKELTS